MRPFAYERPRSVAEAARMAAEPGAMLCAGGTTMLDLMILPWMGGRARAAMRSMSAGDLYPGAEWRRWAS